MKQIRLAPAYDIVSTIVYEESTRDMAFYIGGEVNRDKLTRSNFEKAAKDVGLGSKMAMGRFDHLCSRFRDSLSEAATELESLGFEKTRQIYRRILDNDRSDG